MSRLAILRYIMNKFLLVIPVFAIFISIVANAADPLPVPITPGSKKVPVATSAEKPVSKLTEQERKEIVYRTNLGRASDVRILIEKGASPDETNSSGVPLISLAASRSDSEGLEMVKMLVEKGADINQLDPRGKNALFYAAKIGNKDIVGYLLDNKIRYSATDNSGNTARVAAYQTGNYEIVEMLDNFVRGQNEAVRKQYESANKEIEQRYKAYNDAVQEQTRKDSEVLTTEEDIIKDGVYKLSYASCSAAYWQYCSSVRQPTQYSLQDLSNNIFTQTGKINEFSNFLITEHHVASTTVQNISSVSGNNIKAQLEGYSSNDERRDNGVGTTEDMNRRCESIANTWNTTVKDAPKRSGYRMFQ